MANIYVSLDRGSDSNAGTATSPYLTLNKAVGASGVAAAGDTVYIEPGIYRARLDVGVSGTAGSPVAIVGDGDGAGFLAGGYATPKTGAVEIRAWTDDATPLTTGAVVAANGKSYITIKAVKLISGNGSGNGCLDLSGVYSDWTIEDCRIIGSPTRGVSASLGITAGAAANVVFRRCLFATASNSSANYSVQIRSPLNAVEYDVNVLFQNCIFMGGAGGLQLAQVGGTGTGWATGVRVQQCTFAFCNRGVYSSNNPVLTTPNQVYGCMFLYCWTGVAASDASQLIEDGNQFAGCITNRTSVPAGTHSVGTAAPAVDFYDDVLFGGVPRPLLEPSAVSSFLGAGNYGSPPVVDFRNRPRPAGGYVLSSVGAVERSDTGVKDVVHQDVGSPACMALKGASNETRPVLVSAGAPRTIAVKVRWDGNHGDSSKPRAALLANAEVGFAGEVKTAVTAGGSGATPNSYETLTFTAFTPSSDGVVLIRMESRAAASNGYAYFDTITVS